MMKKAVSTAALGRIDADQSTQTIHKALRVREFGAAGQRPFRNEGFDLIVI